jgi:prepilin-type N-terminal cleavage/methylation domain-containing protein
LELGQAVKIKQAKGFSLIELIIVIAILGIVSAIAAPNFNKYRQNTNLKEAARDLASDISLYRQRAVAENIHYQIVFNQAANNYTVQRETVLNSGVYNLLIVTKSPSAISGGSVIISNVNLNNQWITFQPRGTLDVSCAAIPCSVTLQHTVRLSTATINTYLTGRVVNVTYNLQN